MGVEGGVGEGNLSRMLLDISCYINATYFSCLHTHGKWEQSPLRLKFNYCYKECGNYIGSEGTLKLPQSATFDFSSKSYIVAFEYGIIKYTWTKYSAGFVFNAFLFSC